MKIVLIRHAQSEWQIAPGEDWDSPLSRLGRLQAERLAFWLASRPFDVGYLCTSPMRRARQTLDPVAAALGMPITDWSVLAEAAFHVSEDLQAREGPFTDAGEFVPPERYAAWKRTARAALEQLMEQAEATRRPVVAMSHGGLIKTLLRVVVSSDTVDFRLYNTGLTYIEWHRGRWHLVQLNQMDHLPVELRTL